MSDWTWTITYDKGNAWLTLFQVSGWNKFKVGMLEKLHFFDNRRPISLTYRLCCWAIDKEDALWQEVAQIPLNTEQVNEIQISLYGESWYESV